MDSYNPLIPVAIVPPVCNVQSVKTYGVLQGATKINSRSFVATSVSESAINFTCNPPSGVIIDRNQRVTVPIRLTLTGTVVATNGAFVPASTLLNAGKDAPRAFPLSSNMTSLSANINNTAVSIQLTDIIHPLSHYNSCAELNTGDYSTTPCMVDSSQEYAQLDGTNRNPLAGYGAGIQGVTQARGAFPFTIVSNPVVTPTTGAGTAAVAVVDMVVTENLFLSPFAIGKADKQGFYNVETMSFFMNFLSNAMRMWSHSSSPIAVSGANSVLSNISSITAQFKDFNSPAFSYTNDSQPTMLFKYLTPNIVSSASAQLGNHIPITYPYSTWQPNGTDFPALSFGNSTQVTCNALNLSQIPKSVFIFARPNNNVIQNRSDLCDAYLAIEKVNIEWANQSSILDSATKQQLYKINVANGSTQSWEEWSGVSMNNSAFLGTVGAGQIQGSCGPIKLNFGEDIQLEPNQAPGLRGSYNFQATITVKNVNSTGRWDNLPMTLYIIFQNEGTFTIVSRGVAVTTISPLTQSNVLDAQAMKGVGFRENERGGDWFSSIGDFLSNAHDFVKDNKIISNIAPLIPLPGFSTAGTVAKALGYGNGGCEMGGAAIQGGQAIQGGKMISKANMQRRMLSDR